MATRYWVGGAGTWDATTTTNWSATSGGSGGASAPTSVDNVIFDTLSNATAYAVTVGTNAAALDVTIAGPATGNVTITSGATAVINCYGSWTNAATGVVFTTTQGAILNFLAATTGKTITTNNVTLGALIINFNNASGGWTLGSAFTITTQATTLTAGSFNTNNFAFNGGVFVLSGTGVRSLTLGSSTVTLTGTAVWTATTTTNLTFNAGTSTINFTGASPTFAGGGLTYGTVNFTSTSGGVVTLSGVNTFTTLNITSPASNRKAIFIGNSMSVTGTLTLGAANAYNARIQVQSTNVGSAITLTVATIAALSDVDFRDIIAAGASGTWSGTRLGNGLGNSNITFVAGKTVYWNLVAGGSWSANAWATSSGGAVATANFPLAQDTAIIDNTGLTASNTITVDAAWWIGTLNVTRTNAWTFAFSSGPSIYGDVTLTSVTTVTGTAGPNFLGQGLTQTLTTNGVLLSMGFSQTSVGGILLLNGNLTTASTQTTTLNNGTLNLAGFTLSTGAFTSSNTNTRVIAFGVGKIVVTSNNNMSTFNADTATNFSFTGSGNIEGAYSGSVGSRTFNIGNSAGGSQAVALNISITAGTDIVRVYGTWNNVDFTGFTGTLNNAGNKIYYGNLTLSTGMSLDASAGATITFAATSGPKTITSAGKTIDYPVTFNGIGGTWVCQDALTLGSTRTLTLTNGTLKLAAGVTSTVGMFATSGTNPKFLLSSTPGTQATISDASGTITVTYLTIQDSAATGGATWDASASTNVDAGNNTGWFFGTTPADLATEITMRLRSFTQPRRF
jgi:hypothetical protein